jgi:glycosyltransferase involved in cell wall biosynthesis
MHPQVQPLLPYTHYSPYLFYWKLLLAQFYFLLHHPLKYFYALRRAIWQTLPELKTCLMTFLLFPKSVYFAKQLKELDINHVHAHFVWLNGVSAQIAADLLGISCSLHAHSWDIFRRNKECVRRQLKLATCVITVSEYHRQYLNSLFPASCQPDIRIVHYGVDPAEFTPLVNKSNNHPVQITSIGRHVEKKGFRYLIEACSILERENVAYHCSIVGEGQSEDLEARIKVHGLSDYITLVGAKNITEIQSIYQQTDIFALPCVIARSGDRDGMPNVLLEAMAMQLPVVTTPVTGNSELIRDGFNGLMVPIGDADALATAIERLINDPSLRARLGIQGRQTVLEGYNIHSTSAQMALIFQELLNKPKNSCAWL